MDFRPAGAMGAPGCVLEGKLYYGHIIIIYYCFTVIIYRIWISIKICRPYSGYAV